MMDPETELALRAARHDFWHDQMRAAQCELDNLPDDAPDDVLWQAQGRYFAAVGPWLRTTPPHREGRDYD